MPKKRDADQYEAHKKREAERQAEHSAAGRDIAPIPAVVDPARRQIASTSLRVFAETYFPSRIDLAWSPDHRRALEILETCARTGGQFAFAMPRGSGKTTLAEITALWALCYALRRYLLVVAATDSLAEQILDSIKIEFETNELLFDDFPEICYPIRKLEGIPHRCKGQICGGERTRTVFGQKELVLPTIAGSLCSGSIVQVAGITGSIRGRKHVLASGESIRPDLVLADDPQTDESAKSPKQNADREAVLTRAIMGLAGPKKKIAVVVPCTVIAPGDLADRILDRERNPAWQGFRARMLTSLPTNMDLWHKYREIRRESQRNGNQGREATEFYRSNQKEMDLGACSYWPERFNADEISAIQSALNVWCDNPLAFAAECQNAPEVEGGQVSEIELKPDRIAARLTTLERRVAPADCTRLTAFIDVQKQVLFYLAVAWNEKFGGCVVDYGTAPKQTANYFDSADARPGLEDVYPRQELRAQLYQGLIAVVNHLANSQYSRQPSLQPMKLERILIDANWGESTDVVYEVAQKSPHAALILPSHGRGIGAANLPIESWKVHPGDRVGLGWRIPADRRRHVVFDSNRWKTFVAERLNLALGSPGALWLFGKSTIEHQLLADHLVAEVALKTSGRGRELNEWRLRPGIRENHWWDCLVGCAVAASVGGLALGSADPAAPVPSAEARRQERVSDIVKRKWRPR